jgi:DedD protein
MAFFKFRKGGADDGAAPAAPAESVDVLRRRARHRLIGAGVLVLVGVIGFPLLFDTQPRPVAVDIPIEIPDRNKARPLPAPVAKAPAASEQVLAPSAAVASAPVAAAKPASAAASRPVATGVVTSMPEPKPEPKVEAKAEPKEPAKPAVAAASRPAVVAAASKPAAPKPDDAARAQALLEGKTVEAKPVQANAGNEADAKGVRYVVQVGAFSDAAKAKEAQRKLQKAGLKNYVNEADTKDGKRTRVRAGPFDSKAEAEKAADRIKGLEMATQILTL